MFPHLTLLSQFFYCLKQKLHKNDDIINAQSVNYDIQSRVRNGRNDRRYLNMYYYYYFFFCKSKFYHILSSIAH